ncbi:hypothetical protein J1N35_038155 [Gossypium stocksii]|uniref:Uncharacterized protein n=1 Tax=Gossypium stocksii TaxID=47602 RepID=A0A9D3ZLL3_9ROSI|nr:hypothetical protein J1N35_038155 [Gossypium stocksii]
MGAKDQPWCCVEKENGQHYLLDIAPLNRTDSYDPAPQIPLEMPPPPHPINAIKGIALPLGHDKLYSGSSDGTARIWDGHIGKCLHFTDLRDEAGSLITEGSWCSLACFGVLQALNIHSALELNLKGPVGQVSAMILAGDMLIAGAKNCGIIAWRASCETDSFQLAVFMEGHNGAVSCLAVACGRQNVIFWVPG